MADDRSLLVEEKGYSTFDNRDGGTITSDGKNGGSYTVSEAVEKMGFGRFQVKAGIAAGFAWVADGMEIMALSVLGPVLLCEWKLEVWEEAFITTIVFLGFFFGSPTFGFLADKIGRRKSLLISSLWIFIFGAASSLSPNYPALLVLRFLTGFGVGGGPQAITYFSEFLPNSSRGRSVLLVEVFWALGGMLEVVLAILILVPFGWRWWLFVSAFPSLVFVIACFFLQDSPRYSLACGNADKALATLKQAAKDNRSELPPGELVKEPEVKRANFMDLIQPKYRVTSGLLAFLWFSAAFSYYGIILFTTDMIKVGSTCDPYAYNSEYLCYNKTTSESFVSSGRLGNSSILSAIAQLPSTNTSDTEVCTVCQPLALEDYYGLLWTSAAELPGILITAFLVDVLGRKKTLALEFFIFGTICFCLFICMSRVPMIVVLVIGRAFISSAFQVIYVYTPEVYHTSVRALSVGMGSMFGRVGATITPYIAEVLLDASFYYGLGVYGVIGLIAAIVSLILPIETKGDSLH